MNNELSYLNFIEKYHPQYYSDDRVLLCDILFRYLSDDEVSSYDIIWLQKEFKTKEEAIQELRRLETLLFSEALGFYYEKIGLSAKN